MKPKRLSLQARIFISMLLVVLVASILIIGVAVLQYREQAKDYHNGRLLRKENAIKRSLTYQLDDASFLLESRNLAFITQKKLNEISKIHRLKINIFDLKGKLLKTSYTEYKNNAKAERLNKSMLNRLAHNHEHRVVENKIFENEKYIASYSYIYNEKAQPIGILNIPYLEKGDFFQKELNELLKRIFLAFFIVVLLAVAIAYFSSRYITKPIKTLIDKMQRTELDKSNEKIQLQGGSEEIHNLVEAYNAMIDQLEDSAVKLAQSERESAWREMAKQVAHEIKNPLTPMRLSVQSFQRRFDPTAEDAQEQLNSFSHTIIQQIDTMTSIASAFSDFAKMPTAKKETLDVVKVVKHAVDIFAEPHISFYSNVPECYIDFDKTQMVRVVTNLVTNANQALSDVPNPKIEVKVTDRETQVQISVADNGKGIAEDVKLHVFEPKFTTKSSGMGLGLPMVKSIVEAYGGNIQFVSEKGKGTVFTLNIPKK